MVIALRACLIHLVHGVDRRKLKDVDCVCDLLKSFRKLCVALWNQRRLLVPATQQGSMSVVADPSGPAGNTDSESQYRDDWEKTDDDDDDDSASWCTEDSDSELDEEEAESEASEDRDESSSENGTTDSSQLEESSTFGDASMVCVKMLVHTYMSIR